MAGAYLLPYYPIHIPEPYEVTHVRKTYPEHHLPLEDMRHRVAQGVHGWFSDIESVRTPRADVRETLHNYYVEVDLPGVNGKDDLKLKWTNFVTLLVEATRPKIVIPEEEEAAAAAAAAAKPAEEAKEPAGEAAKEQEPKEGKKKHHPDHPVHRLVSERQEGKYVRAFSFPVRVDRDKMDAHLQHGLLRIVVPKLEEEKTEPKHASFRHGDTAMSFEVSPGIST